LQAVSEISICLQGAETPPLSEVSWWVKEGGNEKNLNN
jgi:hypothetical protein